MEKNFDAWNQKKKSISIFNRVVYAKKRELWWCSLGINIGDEQDGRNNLFERPVLVIKKFNDRFAYVVPLSTKIKNNPYYFVFTRDTMQFSALLSQARSISTKRLTRKIGRLDRVIFLEIVEALKRNLF